MSLNLDKSTWKRIAFGDVVRNANVTVRDAASAGIDRIIAMEHMDPGELKISRWGSVADGTTFTRLVEPRQTLFGKRRAYQRKVGYADFSAVCSGDIYTFEADGSELLPEFLPFLVQSDAFFDHALGTSAGSLSPRTNWRDLAKFEFDLPPLDDQMRIADLLWAVERHQIALTGAAIATSDAMRLFLHDRFESFGPERARIIDLCSAVVGGVWGSPAGVKDVDVLALGPRVYAGGATLLSPEASPVRSITDIQARSRLIEAGDIVLERSGGSPEQPVGRVVIAGEGLPACVPTDFQRLLRPDRRAVEPLFLFWRLRLDWLEGLTREFSKRTTNISNLSVPDYLDREVAIPARDEQVRLIEEVQSFEGAIAALRAERAEVLALRSAVIANIFGGP